MAIFQSAPGARELLAAQWPFVLTAVLASVVAWIFQVFLREDVVSKIPLVGREIIDDEKRRTAYMMGARNMYIEGYRKIKSGIFRVPAPKDSPQIVLHPRFLKELSALPDDQISFHEAIVEKMHTQWTGVRADNALIPFVIKRDLTPALGRLNPTIAEEVDRALQEELPPCKEFTKVHVQSHLLRIIARVSGRIFVGPEVGRSEEYLDMSINYTLELIKAVDAISSIKPDQRQAKAQHLPECKILTERKRKTLDFLRPLLAARKKSLAEDPDYQSPDDVVQWILRGTKDKYGEQSDDALAEVQLGMTFASIHTTTYTTMNAFYTLAAKPEIVPELREEVREVLKEYGTFTAAAVQRMKKLDSFLHETMRVWPLGLSSFNRKLLKPLTLSNGQYLPAGVLIEVPSDSFMNDPSVFENPQEFDALRSYKASAGLGGASRANAAASNQLVTVSMNSLNFGYGRHACPGRFFAANEIKMIVGRSLLDYDIKLVDGATERYPNIAFQDNYLPDPTKELMFKRIAC